MITETQISQETSKIVKSLQDKGWKIYFKRGRFFYHNGKQSPVMMDPDIITKKKWSVHPDGGLCMVALVPPKPDKDKPMYRGIFIRDPEKRFQRNDATKLALNTAIDLARKQKETIEL